MFLENLIKIIGFVDKIMSGNQYRETNYELWWPRWTWKSFITHKNGLAPLYLDVFYPQWTETSFRTLVKVSIFTGLTSDEIIAQEMVFYPTAYDTTASTITFLLYNLALHPEIQEKVYEEITTVAGDEVWQPIASHMKYNQVKIVSYHKYILKQFM